MKKTLFTMQLISILPITFMNIGCKNESCEWAPPPNVFYFLIEKNGERLPDSVLQNTIMYCYDSNGVKITDPDGLYSGVDLDDTVFMFPATRSSSNLANTGVMEGLYLTDRFTSKRTFYLEYPDGDVDTFYVAVTKISCKEAQQNRCYCETPYTTVKFNGHDAPEVTDLHTDDGKPIFLFEK